MQSVRVFAPPKESLASPSGGEVTKKLMHVFFERSCPLDT